jgi:glyoxylase I family protein
MPVKIKHKVLALEGVTTLLQVFDMIDSLNFYRDVLGFKVIEFSGEEGEINWAFLRHNNINLMLNNAYETSFRPYVPDPSRQLGHGDTILYIGCPDIDTAYIHLRLKGLEVDKPLVTEYGWKAINFADPDGYHICLHWPAFDISD